MNSKRVKEEPNPSHIFGEKIKADGIRHVVNVTLQTAKQFENCNSLYVHYVVEAPPDCVLAEGSNVHGVTHQSRPRDDSTNHFGHRFTLDVSTSWQQPTDPEAAEPMADAPLLLLFQVYDVDVWNRQKSVGYGFTFVPFTAGRSCVTVQTWRPHVTETNLRLKEYFLGLAPQIENIKYAGPSSSNYERRVVCRFPFATESSGEIEIQFDTMTQRGRDVLRQQQIRRQIHVHRPSATSAAVEQVIDAYHRAKRRLKAAHDALLR